MKIVRNISKKYVGIGTTALAPDAEMSVDDKIASSPGINAMARRKLVLVMEKKDDGDKNAAGEPADASGDGPAEAPEKGDTETVAAETTAPKRRGRKSAETEAADAQ